MESETRGVIEKTIDYYITSDSLYHSITSFEELAPIIKSKEDAIFGFVIGRVVSEFHVVVLARYRRTPTREELEDLNAVLLRRAEEIRNRIRVAMMGM